MASAFDRPWPPPRDPAAALSFLFQIKGTRKTSKLEQYFMQAATCHPDIREVGIETESLLVDPKINKPITLSTSQELMQRLIASFGWSVAEERNGLIVRLQKELSSGFFYLFYELGWNNIELVTPTSHVEDQSLFEEHDRVIDELKQAAKDCQARLIDESWDNDLSNTLIMPDERDEIWLELDGEVLYHLGHISTVHFNIDLSSINEGMEWITKLNRLFKELDWPSGQNALIWHSYVKESNARYEQGRYGPPSETFEEYTRQLASYKVVMNRNGQELVIAKPVKPFREVEESVNINLFLRSVWWYPRLRVRNGRLVLEIRDVPRSIDVRSSYRIIKDVLGF